MAKEVYYRSTPALCQDGVERKVYVRCYWTGREWSWYCDTFSTTPAFVKVRGKTIRGFVTRETRAGFQTATDDDPAVTKFIANKGCKNGSIIEDKRSAANV